VDDERGEKQKYFNNSTGRMMRLLSEVAPDQLHKIVTIDSGVGDIDTGSIMPKPDICFIDGEHTNAAAVADFDFCRKVLSENGVILFHDSDIVYKGIQKILSELRHVNLKHVPTKLSGSVLMIVFGDSTVLSDSYVRSVSSSVRYHFLRSAVRLQIGRYKFKRKAGNNTT
jgi:hypothetical protein